MDAPALWERIAAQAPALGALIFLVLKFLSFLKEQRESRITEDQERDIAMNKVVENNSRVMEECVRTMAQTQLIVTQHEKRNAKNERS